MKKTYSKTITALICLLAMLSGALVSCDKKAPSEQGNDNTDAPPTVTSNSDGTPGNAGGDGPAAIDYTTFITKETFDYDTIRILVQKNEILQFDVGEEEPTDKVEQAFYRRNCQVEDTHEVELEFKTGDTEVDYVTKLTAASLGGDSYDIVETWHWYINKWTYFADMQQYTDILHFENPYWSSGANNNTLINGKQYIAFGQGSPSVYASAMVVFYNEHLRLDYELDEFFPLVESGDWTIENMLVMMEKATQITNETENSYDNKYGLGYNLWAGRAFLWGCGMQMSTYHDGELNITLANETNYNIFNKVKNFLTSNRNSYYGGGGGFDTAHLYDSDKNDLNAFINYKLLFESNTLRCAEKISQSMPTFGVLPMPKLDTTQKDYITPVQGVSPFGIMKTSSDPRRAAIVLETFTIYSYLTVRPEYYESALKLRYQTDSKAADMVDMIIDHLSIDFLFINSAAFEYIADQAFNLIDPFCNWQVGYYSYMGSYQNKMEVLLSEFLKTYEEAEKTTE